jgi:hypothetical protein
LRIADWTDRVVRIIGNPGSSIQNPVSGRKGNA